MGNEHDIEFHEIEKSFLSGDRKNDNEIERLVT
jgi:hypothetical protein